MNRRRPIFRALGRSRASFPACGLHSPLLLASVEGGTSHVLPDGKHSLEGKDRRGPFAFRKRLTEAIPCPSSRNPPRERDARGPVDGIPRRSCGKKTGERF